MNTSFPPEILGEIFIHYVHDCDCPKMARVDVDVFSPLRSIATYPDCQTLPTDLTCICRLWRETAISIPQLWATIYASAPLREGDVKTFELWLERSAGPAGTHPLDLAIKQEVWYQGKDESKLLERILCLAISQSQRWESISLELYHHCEPLFNSLNSAAFSNLRGVKISVRWWTTDGLHLLLGVLCSSPALQSIEFGRYMSEYDFDKSLLDVVPWSRVQRLAFPTLDHGPCLYILASSAETLQHVSISKLIEGHLPGVSKIPHTTMYQLQSMRIDRVNIWDHDDLDIGLLFDKLTLPSLHTLCLSNGFDKFESVRSDLTARGWKSLFNLLERSNCKLQIFEFGDDKETGSMLTEASLTEHLASPLFENLTSLRVTSMIGIELDSPQLLDALSEVCENVQRPRFLPHLETLVLDSVSSIENIREMVSARVAAYGGYCNSKLRRVSAEFREEKFVLDMDLASQNHL